MMPTLGWTKKRLVFPVLANLYKPFAPYSYAFMRFCTGVIMVPHGYAKLFEGGVWHTGGVERPSGFGHRLPGLFSSPGSNFSAPSCSPSAF